jgi:GTPase SAR1 family protein
MSESGSGPAARAGTPSIETISAARSSAAAFHSYSDYARVLIRCAVAVNTLLQQGRTLGLSEEVTRLDQTLRHLEAGAFSIAVVGEFKRGKSTVINALLGSSTLPTDAMPATASVTRVVYGRESKAVLRMRDGSETTVPIVDLAQHITKIDAAAAARAANVAEAVVSYPTLFCQNNVEVIDTPGLSDEEAMTRLTLDIIPKTDAAVFVISALTPFGRSEVAFLEQLITTVDPGRLFFLLTHIDCLKSKDDVERVTALVRRRVRVAIKAANPDHPADPPVRLFPVSAWQALQGKESRDNKLYHGSRFPEFERALETYLARDRGAAALARVAQVIRKTSAVQIAALAKRTGTVKHREAKESARNDARLGELDAIVRAMAEHITGLETRAKQHEQLVRAAIERELTRLQGAIEKNLFRLSMRDDFLNDGEARTRLVRDTLQGVVFPLADELSKTIVSIVEDWGNREDEIRLTIARRLDVALADRELETDGRTNLQNVGVNSASMLADEDRCLLQDFGQAFRDGFKPPTDAIAEQGLDVARHVLGNDAIQKGYRQIRSWIQNDGARRAEIDLRKTQDRIRDALRNIYTTKTRQHISALFSTLALETKSVDAVNRLGHRLGIMLEREQGYVTKLVEWRQLELKIERARRQAASEHECLELEVMQGETREIASEAKQHAAILARALDASMVSAAKDAHSTARTVT